MKVIYEANDGTEFDSEVECKKYENTQSFYEKSNKVEELLDIADRECDSYFYTKRKITDFIIENIQEINSALGVQQSKYTFTGGDGQEYVSQDDPDNSCLNCGLYGYDKEGDCSAALEKVSCGEHKIIWIKK